MTNVTSLDDRRPKSAPSARELSEWLYAADAELSRVAANPNEVLDHLLAAGCEVTFRPDSSGAEAIVKMPDASTVNGYGIAAAAALVDAYQAGAYLADLPAVLSATAEG